MGRDIPYHQLNALPPKSRIFFLHNPQPQLVTYLSQLLKDRNITGPHVSVVNILNELENKINDKKVFAKCCPVSWRTQSPISTSELAKDENENENVRRQFCLGFLRLYNCDSQVGAAVPFKRQLVMCETCLVATSWGKWNHSTRTFGRMTTSL